ncbi:helical backbone metal receptor [Rhodocytophaga aerolata]|uniref:Helical backbone metal receptor n=1 Tax=Rhodocytophaga aerolata TaxID=455078 RepID=A0ABT8RC91_9BACT|nr:helical backbone metal receptor [Rhodocytophaga aerolata]MDO1448798.1 helical backbone metal receptor [Rhodocytophaga aerolata]
MTLPSLPKRIISLVPSQTELLVDLGLEERIVGITKFCIHPPHLLKTKTIIGGTKNFNFSRIDQLQPDLIIGNKEENYKEGIEALQQRYPVWISDIKTMEDALAMIHKIGSLTGKEQQASELVKTILTSFQDLTQLKHPPTVAYFIWQNPYMVAASHTFIDQMLSKCGFINVFAHLKRYPQITKEQLTEANPEYIFLSSEPYPFKEEHLTYFKEIYPQAIVKLVDGEMFSWYGSRLLYSPAYFKELIRSINAEIRQAF